MRTIMLEIEESYVEKFLHLLEALPRGMVSLRGDALREELSRRITQIDDNPESVSPYMDGMDAMLDRVKAAHADR